VDGDLGGARAGTTSSLGLQAIHTADREVFGYELLHRTGTVNRARLSGEAEHDRATAQVVAATFGEFGVEELSGGRPLFLTATRSFFTGRVQLPFPPGSVVLELLEDVDVDRRLMAGLVDLRRRGFRIAVDDFDGETSRIPAVLHADYVKIDLQVTGERLPEVLDLVRRVNPGAVLVVERVETQAQFDVCLDLGVDLFQGYLLHRPEVLQRQTLTPSHLTCVQLVALLSDTDADVGQVVDLLSQDPALSLRVLKTVSSAAHAPRGGITSLRQAVVMLGRRELMGWVLLVLLAGSGSARVPDETLAWIFARAEACRALRPTAAEPAFTVGLLSGAAEALAFDPVELTRGCALDPSVRDALVAGAGPLGVALTAVRGHESLVLAGSEGETAPDTAADVAEVYLRAQVTARARVAAFRSPQGPRR
jgi:EAL and modified HD-GYP domain-containing signal transduction protein